MFASLGELLADLRWGLPSDDPMTVDPWLAALFEQYTTTIGRLQRSFVGPEQFEPPEPVPEDAFRAEYRGGAGDTTATEFARLQARTEQATGRSLAGEDLATSYRRYREWLPFDRRTGTVLRRVALRLGYDPADVAAIEAIEITTA